MDPLKTKYNLTTAFMLPILLDKGIQRNKILTETFIDTYIADLNKPETVTPGSNLLIRYATITNLPEWTKEFKIYESKDGSIMVMVEIPNSIIKDYTYFLLGDYSKFKKIHKTRIKDFWESYMEDDLIYGVMYKQGEVIYRYWEDKYAVPLGLAPPEFEYWRPPDMKKEIFGIGQAN